MQNGKYKALTVANHIIAFYAKQQCPITNLRLQKLLYFAWVNHFIRQSSFLFDDEICAWQLGPVVPVVYDEFCIFSSNPIYPKNSIEEPLLVGKDKEVLESLLQSGEKYSTSDLVAFTHEHNTPWDITFQNGYGNRSIIPFRIIIKSIQDGVTHAW